MILEDNADQRKGNRIAFLVTVVLIAILIVLMMI